MIVSVGLTFPGALQDESVICSVCKKYEVNVNIIEASFSMSSGWAILQFDGSEKEINKVFAYLQAKDIRIQKIKTKK